METYSAGGVVFNKLGQVLLVSQHGSSWSLPKGHLEGGEDAQMAARREIEEETGITNLHLVKELGTYHRYRMAKDPSKEDKSEHKNITMFLFRTGQFNLKPEDPTNPEAHWVGLHEALDILSHPKDREFLEKIIPDLENQL